MRGPVLVINSGSSSIKFAVFSEQSDLTLQRELHGEIDALDGPPHVLVHDRQGVVLTDRMLTASAAPARMHEELLTQLLEWLAHQPQARSLEAVGHRVVHGGALFTEPTRITDDVMLQLESLCPLAPLHQAHNLAAIRIIGKLQPALTQVACFDTAFHATQSWAMRAFALPQRIVDAGVRRYGFHGLSYEYIVSAMPKQLSNSGSDKVVIAHLGGGASMCAVRDGKSVATTMGFTALDGLMMDTRCGSLDPGVILYLMKELAMSVDEVETLLYTQSGLLGVSGIAGDMRLLEASTDAKASHAIDLYVSRITRELGGLAATLGGIDALIFTAGIGEHSAAIRSRVCSEAAWLGIDIDEEANASNSFCISRTDVLAKGHVSVWVIPTNEELMIARHRGYKPEPPKIPLPKFTRATSVSNSMNLPSLGDL
jgi:acetate kinase